MIPRYDLLLVPRRRAMRVAPNGAKALVNHLLAEYYCRDPKAADDDLGTRVRLTPGPNAHTLFHEGESRGITPVFETLTIASLKEAQLVPFPGLFDPVYFYVQIKGAAFDTVNDELEARLDSILYMRPELLVRPR